MLDLHLYHQMGYLHHSALILYVHVRRQLYYYVLSQHCHFVQDTETGITATMVGLGHVNHHFDALKLVSTATATALSSKARLAVPLFTGYVGIGSSSP